MSLLEPEIRSQVSIWTSGYLNESIINIKENVESLTLKSLDTKPLWITHLLTKRRPNITEIARVLNETFSQKIDYVSAPVEDDLVIVSRVSSLPWIETCAIITVEPAYAGGEVCYWLRCSIYEASEITSQQIGILRAMASFFEVLDYPDAALIDRHNYSFRSKASIAAYARDPKRTQTLFLIPKSAADTRAVRLTI